MSALAGIAVIIVAAGSIQRTVRIGAESLYPMPLYAVDGRGLEPGWAQQCLYFLISECQHYYILLLLIYIATPR
jgi:hypothetical protein